MITNYADLLQREGWQQGQMVETDIWIGHEVVRHFTHIMIIDDKTLYGTFDQLFQVVEGARERKSLDDRFVFNYADVPQFIAAHTQEEALADVDEMLKIDKDAIQKKLSKCKNRLNKALTTIGSIYNELNYSDSSTLCHDIVGLQGKEYKDVRIMLDLLGFRRERYNYGDVMVELVNIINKHGFIFNDPDNEYISTFISIDHVVSAETECQYDGKDCIVLHMDSGKSYKIFEEDGKCIYKALYEIYN